MQTVRSSIYNPDFYSKIKHQSLLSALKYFFLLILALAFINTLILSYELAVKIPDQAKKFVAESVKSYPADLEVSIDDGQVSTNAQEPFFVPMPNNDEYNDLNNILVIDTKTPFSSTQFGQYKTMLWLTRDSLFYQNREFDTRSLDLSKFDNIKIDRQFIQTWANKISPWLNLIGPALILAVFIGLFLGFAFNLIYFLLLALLVFFLSAIFKWGLDYKSAYKTALYASTLAFLLDLVLFNTGLYTGFFGFPFLFTLAALCAATVNLQNFEKND